MNKKELKKILNNYSVENHDYIVENFLIFFKESLKIKCFYETLKDLYSIDNIKHFPFTMYFIVGSQLKSYYSYDNLSNIFCQIIFCDYSDFESTILHSIINSTISEFLIELKTNVVHGSDCINVEINDNFTINDLSEILNIEKKYILEAYNKSNLMNFDFEKLKKTSDKIKDELNVIFI